MAEGLTHFDDEGRARMVDVSPKQPTARTARAEATVTMPPELAERVFANDLPKGDALAVSRIAAIMGAKKTSELVPLCHPLPIEDVAVEVVRVPEGARVEVTVRVTAKTGVEMEAMTAAAIGAIALYDMVKGADKGVTVGSVRLLEKTGGKSGDWSR